MAAVAVLLSSRLRVALVARASAVPNVGATRGRVGRWKVGVSTLGGGLSTLRGLSRSPITGRPNPITERRTALVSTSLERVALIAEV